MMYVTEYRGRVYMGCTKVAEAQKATEALRKDTKELRMVINVKEWRKTIVTTVEPDRRGQSANRMCNKHFHPHLNIAWSKLNY